MTFIPPWLKKLSFTTDPYSSPQAENLDEDLINPLYVYSVFEPRFLNPELSILIYPGSTVVHGWGKTMGVRWMQGWAKDKRSSIEWENFPFVVLYNHFMTPDGMDRVNRPQQHIRPFMAAFTASFLGMICEQPDLFLSQPDADRQKWWGILNGHLPENWGKTALSSSLDARLLADRRLYDQERLPLEGELDQIVFRLADWLAELGVDRIYIAVDNVTGYLETKDPRQAANLLKPLIHNDQLFHIPGLYWKFFVSDDVKNELGLGLDFSPRRFRIFPITWRTENLVELIERTLRACAKLPFYTLNALCDPPIHMDITQELAEIALLSPGNTPNNMLVYVGELMQRAFLNDSEQISPEVLNNFLSDLKNKSEKVRQAAVQNEAVGQEIAQSAQPKQEKVPMEGDVKTNSDGYNESRGKSIQKRVDALTQDLENLEEHRDYAYNVLERRRLELDIDQTKQNIQSYRSEIDGLEKGALPRVSTDLSASKSKLGALEARIRKLEAEMAMIHAFVVSYPEDIQPWAGQILETIDGENYLDVLHIVSAIDQLPNKDFLALIAYVQKLPVLLPDNRRSKLIKEAKETISKADPTINGSTCIKISIPIIPLIMNWETEIKFEGKDLREIFKGLWKHLIKSAGPQSGPSDNPEKK